MNLISLTAKDCPIISVTVFRGEKSPQSSTAEVLRTLSVDLQPGQNAVSISHFSSSLDPDTVHLTGLGDAACILDLVCCTHYGDESIPESTRALLSQKQLLEDEKTVRQEELQDIESYARSLHSSQVSVADALSFFDVLAERRRSNLAERRQLEGEITRIQESLKQGSPWPSPQGSTDMRVKAIIVARQWSRTRIGSRTMYDLHVASIDGEPSSTVQLTCRAHVTQRTGEDWTGASLMLCTSLALARCDSKIPTLDDNARRIVVLATSPTPAVVPGGLLFERTSQIGLAQPMSMHSMPQAVQPMTESAAVQEDAAVITPQHRQLAKRPTGSSFGAMTPPVQQLKGSARPVYNYPSSGGQSTLSDLSAASGADTDALVNFSVHAETFALPADRVPPLPSDGFKHIVSIAEHKLEAIFTWVCVPSARAAVFVECRMKNSSSPLLKGPVNAYVQDEFVAKTELPDVPLDKTFACSLGVDNGMEVSLTRNATSILSPLSQNAFAERTKTTICVDKATVVNTQAFAIALVVRDTVPVADDKRVVVHVRSAVTKSAADSSNEYECNVEAGQSVTTTFEWEVTTPVDLCWEQAGVRG